MAENSSVSAEGAVAPASRSFLSAGTVLRLLTLAAVLWVARYWHSRGFGLYEDDFTIVPGAASSGLLTLLRYAGDYLINMGGHGRPLSDILYSLLISLGWHIDGLWAAYWIGFLVTLVNVALFYLLVQRIGGTRLAMLAGLGYSLYAADTTQVYLNHSLGLQPALAWFYLAAHAWLSRKPWLVYLGAVGTLLTYETTFPLLFALPLLSGRWDRRMARRLLVNAGILVALLALDAWVRYTTGEGRVAGLSVSGAITTPLTHMLIGPMVSLGTFLYRPLQAIQAISPESALAMLLAFPAFLLVLRFPCAGGVEDPEDRPDLSQGFEWILWLTELRQHRARLGAIPASLRSWLRLATTGVVLVVLAYPLTLTVRAYAISGRDTRVHFAAVVGASLVVGCVGIAILSIAEAMGRRRLASVMVAAFFSLMLGFGFVIQEDYVTAWQYQRDFWTDVLPLIPDLTDGTVILVDPSGLRDTRQIGANYWNMPRVLNQILQFPPDWGQPPRVYRLTPDWRSHILATANKLRLDASTTVAPPSTYQTVDSTQVILLEWKGGAWVRRLEQIQLGGTLVSLKSFPGSAPTTFPEGFLYPLLIEAKPANG